MIEQAIQQYVVKPLRQWRAGLSACLPAAVRQKILPDVFPLVLTLSDNKTGQLLRTVNGEERNFGIIDLVSKHLDAAMAATLKNRSAPLHIELPAAWILSKASVMPAAASSNLRQVIGFEMDRLTPFSLDQVFYDFVVNADATESHETLPVQVAVVPKSHLAGWLEILQRHGIVIDAIVADGLWDGINFLPPESRPGTDVKKVLTHSLPFVLLAALLAVALTIPLWQKRQIALDLQDQERSLRKKSAVVVKVREKLEAKEAHLQKLHTVWQENPPVVDVLKTLTDLLPDDTSLQQLELKGREVVLRGTSRQASDLLKLLEDAPGFSDTKFMSSVVQQRGKEQFHLSAKVLVPFKGLSFATQKVEKSADMPDAHIETPVVAPVPQPDNPKHSRMISGAG